MSSEHDAALELVALARLGLAERLAGAPAAAVQEARVEGLAALERHGVLRAHQARAVRAYVSQHARTCACGRRVLAPEGGGVTPCDGCGADVTSSGGTSPRRPPGTIGPGTRVGPLEVLEKLGAGASGTVYRARHEALGRLSALKVIPRGTLDARLRRRFEREVEALARLDHPGIVKVHAAYEHEGSLAFDMELVDGESLDARLERDGPMPWREAVTLVAQVARAVEHAHEHGVLHRDLKPGNVLVRRDGRALLADLGLSRLTDQSSSLTLAGAPVGTPCYMAPEAFAGETSPQVDVYGLGAILYQALTGRPPFIAESLPALLHLVTRGQCEPTAAPGAPPDLEAVRACAMAPRPEARYPTPGALADDLERLLAGRATSASSTARAILREGPPRGLLAGLVALLLVVIGVVAALAPTRPVVTPPRTDPPPATLDQALAALRRGAHTDAALALVERAARDEAGGAALDLAIERDPAATGLRAARALTRCDAGAPLLAADLAAVASAAVSAAAVERLALHAVTAGLEGPAAERLAAARALATSHTSSRSAATLLALEGCGAGDPALHDEVAAALARGLQTEPRALRLGRVVRLVERVRDALERGLRVQDEVPLLIQEVRALAEDARLARAAEVLLAPLAPVIRAHMRRGALGDLVDGQPRRSLIAAIDAAWPWVPDTLAAYATVLRDTDPELSGPKITAERVARLERAARAVLPDDPVIGGFVLQLSIHQRLWDLGPTDADRLAEIERAEEEVRAVAAATRTRADLAETERLWVARTIQRSASDLVEIDDRRLAWTTDAAARRRLLERSLSNALENLALCQQHQVLFGTKKFAAEDVAGCALALDRLDIVESVLADLRHREAVWAEVLRRRGEVEEAERVARGAVAARPTSEALAVWALALADLGRMAEAHEALDRLVEGGGLPFCADLHPSAVEAHLAARGSDR